MKNYALTVIIALFLVACNSKSPEKESISGLQDTSRASSPIVRNNRLFENALRDINNFDELIGYSLVDELHTSLSKDNNTAVNVERDICAGDNCTSHKSLKNGNTTLHIFKSDGGEYGFSNDEYILYGDTISIVRNFDVGIETWPTDSTETVWSCTENVFYFYPDNVKFLERKALIKDLFDFDFSLKGIEYEIHSFRGSALYKEKVDELNGLLMAKDENE